MEFFVVNLISFRNGRSRSKSRNWGKRKSFASNTHYLLKILVVVPAPDVHKFSVIILVLKSFDQIILCSKAYMCATAQTIPLWSPTLLSQQRVLNKEIDGSAESCVAITGLGR